MAKLRADIAYNRRKQELNSTMAHINNELEEQELINLINEQNKEGNLNDNENALDIENEIDENNDESDSDDDIEKEEAQVQDQLDQWLKILQENNENIDDFDLDIESIDHPAENRHAKWDLKIIFKDNLHCPF